VDYSSSYIVFVSRTINDPRKSTSALLRAENFKTFFSALKMVLKKKEKKAFGSLMTVSDKKTGRTFVFG